METFVTDTGRRRAPRGRKGPFSEPAICVLPFSLVLILALTSPLTAQRRDPDPHDVEAGSSRYLNICASCHGQDGDQVSGVDLGHDTFRRATNDMELVAIIRNGIPGTGMPANRMGEDAAGAIVSYLHSIARDNSRNTSKGNAERGREIFGRVGCTGCHRVGALGARIGPDLTDVGKYRRSVELERAILEPAADIAPQNRFVKVVTASGTQVEGRLLNQDAFVVLLMDHSEKLRSFDRSTLSKVTIEDKQTSMPSFRSKLNDQDVADVVAFLGQQKGIPLQ